MKPIVDQLNPDQVEKYDIDFSDDDKPVQYGIEAVPTFIAVNSEGKEIGRILGITTIEKLQELLA